MSQVHIFLKDCFEFGQLPQCWPYNPTLSWSFEQLLYIQPLTKCMSGCKANTGRWYVLDKMKQYSRRTKVSNQLFMQVNLAQEIIKTQVQVAVKSQRIISLASRLLLNTSPSQDNELVQYIKHMRSHSHVPKNTIVNTQHRIHVILDIFSSISTTHGRSIFSHAQFWTQMSFQIYGRVTSEQ